MAWNEMRYKTIKETTEKIGIFAKRGIYNSLSIRSRSDSSMILIEKWNGITDCFGNARDRLEIHYTDLDVLEELIRRYKMAAERSDE